MTGAPVDRLEMTRLFLRIAEAGSLSAAGRSLGISQPSVSRQLRQLETLLGVQLVRRTTHDLTLTEAGRRFEEEGRALLASWERRGESDCAPKPRTGPRPGAASRGRGAADAPPRPPAPQASAAGPTSQPCPSPSAAPRTACRCSPPPGAAP
ncbi:MAG: LysR family transcriptional regulator [Pseudomonadota bacterium]